LDAPKATLAKTSILYRRIKIMVDRNTTASIVCLAIEMPRSEWSAFAQFLKRIGYEDCARFASPTVTYLARSEGDVIWSAVCLLQRQVAEAGFNPR
jgi:hypothetical protein